MQELLDIIEEEAELMGPENIAGKAISTEEATKDALYSAAKKINKDGLTATLTPTEKAAVKCALEDVGELYLFAGTSAGFDVESKSQEREHQSRGEKARTQAATLGIYL